MSSFVFLAIHFREVFMTTMRLSQFASLECSKQQKLRSSLCELALPQVPTQQRDCGSVGANTSPTTTHNATLICQLTDTGEVCMLQHSFLSKVFVKFYLQAC
jgi:hypothetical protein